MQNEQKKSETWADVINLFFEQKKQIEEINFLKEQIKKINQQYAENNYFDDPNLDYLFDTKKNKKSKGQSDIEFQRTKALKIIRRSKRPENFSCKLIIQNYRSKIESINNKYEPKLWLNKNSEKAASVNFATHVIKLTHSSIDSSSLYDEIDQIKPGLLTTSCLKKKIIDGAVSGNQYAPIFQFLELELKETKLASKFANLDDATLDAFAENDEQLKHWNKGFNAALSPRKKSTHALAKQIFFPVKKNEILKPKSYHLLCNVKSSSFAQAIFEILSGENHKEPEELKKKKKFSDTSIESFVGKAKLGVTKSNHGNASQLNKKRGGKIFLFSTQPPTWQSQLTPPIEKHSLFDYFSTQHINENIRYLRAFLLRFERLGLSIKDPARQAWLINQVQDDESTQFNTIIDEVFFYTSSIQNLPPSWSDNNKVKLKPEHQFFLDPYRDDKSFQNQRKTTNWQSVVCLDFAKWLNTKLVGKDKQFTPQTQHTRLWQQLFETPLREDCESIEATAQQNSQETEV